jgi:type VI secretion system protein ImpE
VKRRTFLFELLCFAGEWDRADRQLDLLAEGGQEHLLGALLYRAAISAERARAERFGGAALLEEPVPEAVAGEFNGVSATTIEDADPRLGARLEVFASGTYLWLPLAHLESVEMQSPKRLRDLLWIPAIVRAGRAFRDLDLGQVLLPALAPFSYRHADEATRLGRKTVWEPDATGRVVPWGQKMLLVDGEEVPLLEVRTLRFGSVPPSA